ncbi:rhodanese-like domain-containing protein [Litorivicinus sp.]|nr:rhodanese-like domain-containing protein [Litorivicinus sp.]MDC1466671.1 rhodanese-like domain-containing protein [Litorivicinus sp.]
MSLVKSFVSAILGTTIVITAVSVQAESKPVGIGFGGLTEVAVKHKGKTVVIKRNQNNDALVDPSFAKTSRACPPFCIQPISLAPGVDTIGEIEMLDYLAQMSGGDDSIMVIDSRTPNWVERGQIPGAVNLPWTLLNTAKGADPISIGEIMENEFGATQFDGLWKFGAVKTLVMYCNGMWCGQSPANIKALLDFGYPAHKIKWYRGGMQNWANLGLTIVKP